MIATSDRIHRITASRRDHAARASRIRRLTRKVADGEYRVDENALAEVLIHRAEFHRRLTVDLQLQRPAAL